MAESRTKTKKHVPRKEKAGNVNATRQEAQESKKVQKDSIQKHHDDKAAQDTVDKKHEKDASTTNTDEQHRMVPVRHPKLPVTSPPKYFVNKDSVVCSNRDGKLRSLRPNMKGKSAGVTYSFNVGQKVNTFKLEEIMAYAFSENFDRNRCYVVHIDGDIYNCVWDNLIVCHDFFTLQQQEIAKLEKLYPGTNYTAVRNMHDTMTFEHYLVSDTGRIYSLRRRKHLALSEDKDGYMQTSLTCDTDTEQTASQHIVLRVHNIVIQSFTTHRPENFIISHINGKKYDNSLKNLKYTSLGGKFVSPRRKKQKPAKEQENASEKTTSIPVLPVTDETNWKTIGTLPWTRLSFSQYEVSDMGHVRRKRDLQLLNVLNAPHGYPRVHIRHDEQISGTNAKSFFVSRLVAGVFVDGYTKTQNTVRHLNGNPLDNRAYNLEWVSKSRSSFHRNARPVVASLVDDPEKRKEYPSLSKAQDGLSISNLSNSFSKHGHSFTREVNWDGEKKMALIQRISFEHDTE